MPSFQDIPQFPRAAWEIDVDWRELEHQIAWLAREYSAQLEPDFQRGHVWTPAQQTAYVEYALQGGELGRVLIFGADAWHSVTAAAPQVVLVDGLQRLTAVRGFLAGTVPAFGHLRPAWTGVLRWPAAGFKFRVVELSTRAEVLRLYLALNAGGTPHSLAEIERVRALLATETTDGR